MKILLVTLHSKYSHASLALPCLATFCSGVKGVEVAIREWTVNEPREHILKLIMAEQADLIAFSCYIWNVDKTLKIVSDIKNMSPLKHIVLGGPEVSFGIFELMHDNPAVDFVVKGEGERAFRQLLEMLVNNNLSEARLAGIDNLFYRNGDHIASGPMSAEPLRLDTIPSPFEAGLVDLTRPLIYYETSRGCPFICAFCLSSVEGIVRSFSMERIKRDLLFLMRHNVSQIKLVDRTFNYDAARASEIWEFILQHNRGSHFHFEIAADLLTENNLQTLACVPANIFRFEIGIQSASENTLKQVGRNADLPKIFSAVRRLKADTQIELHLDLVAGLPGEDYDGFLDSLQQLVFLKPHEIQIEPLKLLKGAPMREIARREDYRFSDFPPYTVLSNPWLSYDDICRIETIARLLDLFQNHGGFTTAFNVLLQGMEPAVMFDKMARNVGNEVLTGFSRRRVYELFARLAVPIMDEKRLDDLNDAIFFDYCNSEMPLLGKLPAFAAIRQIHCSWPGPGALPEGLNLPEGSKIRMFRYQFLFDYRNEPWTNGPVSITFVYVSAAGHGLKVMML